MKMFNADVFASLKRKHGKLLSYQKVEDGDWIVWKKEYGYPIEFWGLAFFDGTMWYKKDDEQILSPMLDPYTGGGYPVPSNGGKPGGKI